MKSHLRDVVPSSKIVLAHDYLTQRGGAERVTLELCRALRPDYLITSLYSPGRTFDGFRDVRVVPSSLNRFGLFRKDPRLALPLLAGSWAGREPVDAEAVVCSSSGWSHALPVSDGTSKIVYCHNPARWLYQEADYLLDQPAPVRAALRALRPMLLEHDRRAAASCDLYIANSTSVAARIREAYGVTPEVLFPPVSVDTEADAQKMADVDQPFFLTVGRARGYKGAQLLVEAFRKLTEQTLVIVGETTIEDCPPNVLPLGFVSEENLRWLYKSARALVSVSREDFGLTPIEANAFGTPVLLLRAGGFLDSTHEGVSGGFIEEASSESIAAAVRDFPREWDADAIRNHAKSFSPEQFSRKMNAIVRRVVASKRKAVSERA